MLVTSIYPYQAVDEFKLNRLGERKLEQGSRSDHELDCVHVDISASFLPWVNPNSKDVEVGQRCTVPKSERGRLVSNVHESNAKKWSKRRH